MENPIVGQFVSTLFASRTQAHIFHLQTDSFAVHKALNEYYDEIVGLTDDFVEGYQGKHGIISGYSNVFLQEHQNSEGIITYFTLLDNYIAKTRQVVCQDSFLQNIIDEIVALINSTLYKLKFLK